MKKVIFVSGTEYSGSTFFHMILANDPHGLAIGEAHNYMRPSRPYHFDMHCSCGEHPCSVWQQLKEGGEERLYQTLFSMFPEVNFIIDSSKNPFWIQDQKVNLDRQGIASQDIVVWKTPYEFAQSYFKRGSLETWERSWVTYHRLYYTLFKNWPAIPYWDLANDRQTLQSVCDYLSIAEFAGKERYWDRSHHVVGGNPSARVHLYTESNENFKNNVQRSTSKIEVTSDGTHRSIYYESIMDPAVKEHVSSKMRSNPHIPAILDLLNMRDLRGQIKGNEVDQGLLQIPDQYVQLRRVKYWLVRRIAAVKNGRLAG